MNKNRKECELDSPNYTRYAEKQLRQVLLRIDADRFPERVAEVHKQLAKFDAFRKQRAPFGAKGPRISIWKSPETTRKKMYAHFVVAAVVCVSALIFQDQWKVLFPIAGVIALGGPTLLAWESRYLLEIYDLGEGFLIKDCNREVYVELTQIHNVSATTHDGGQYEVTLEVTFVTTMGEQFAFFPTAEVTDNVGDISYLEYLKRRVQAAKDLRPNNDS